MKVWKSYLKNNKGVSLIELLVAIAISSIVTLCIGMLITTATRYHNNQGNSIYLQNELTDASREISDALMEATILYVNESGSVTFNGTPCNATIIKTGTFASGTNSEGYRQSENGVARTIIWAHNNDDIHHLIILPYDPAASDSGIAIETRDGGAQSGYVYSHFLTDMDITIESEIADSKAKEYEIIVKVGLTASNDNESLSDIKVSKIRNKIKIADYSHIN